MTPKDRLARASRAEDALREFIEPMLDELRNEYSDRLVEVATTELHPTQRADKITTLSVALKIVNTLEAGMAEIIRDGDLAKRELARADKIENMTDAQQRLLRIGAI